MKYEQKIEINVEPVDVIDYINRFACDYCYDNLTDLLQHNEELAIRELIGDYLDSQEDYNMLVSYGYLYSGELVEDIFNEIVKDQKIQIPLDI